MAVRIYYTPSLLPAMDFLSSMTNTRTHEGEEKKRKTEINSFSDSRSGIDLNEHRHSSPSAHSHSCHFSHRHCTQNTAIDCSEVEDEVKILLLMSCMCGSLSVFSAKSDEGSDFTDNALPWRTNQPGILSKFTQSRCQWGDKLTLSYFPKGLHSHCHVPQTLLSNRPALLRLYFSMSLFPMSIVPLSQARWF